jgi:CheY-like chemotaxis protein
VTAQRDAESRLHQVQKMDAVGQLTGGIAHDFNNLLTVIIGALDLDAERIPVELRPSLKQALRAAERGAALTHRLLAFSRQQTLMAQKVDFNRLIQGMDELLRRALGEHVDVELKLAPDLWPALADGGQVENSLLNLAINARDAMPEGGKLAIETANVHLDEDYAGSNSEVTPGDYVMMAVTDTGTGMAPEVLVHAFEPFFTTKEVGKGTGLGLSMIYGFAKQSGGHLKIYSEIGHGTTVRLYLPRLANVGETAGVVPVAAAPGKGGGETILVVEDNPDVRRLVLRQLSDLGYAVIEAANGPQAMKILNDGVAIDLLFTDVVMPGGMTGRQLAEAAKASRPGLKTLFTSGYTEDSVLRLGKLDPGVRLLSKPYRKHELATRIREALDG